MGVPVIAPVIDSCSKFLGLPCRRIAAGAMGIQVGQDFTGIAVIISTKQSKARGRRPSIRSAQIGTGPRSNPIVIRSIAIQYLFQIWPLHMGERHMRRCLRHFYGRMGK